MEETKEPIRDPFTEASVSVIFALNTLMQTNEVCKSDKAVIKINRFKKWVMDLQDEVSGKESTALHPLATDGVIHFDPSDCPKEN